MSSDVNSYHKVHYITRFKKQIERKLIIESLQYLDPEINIKKYSYFGFGSVYYADYILFHKYLNINSLTSVDNKIDDEPRFNYNKPYDFITFKACESHDYLREHLNWLDKHLIWLDYDSVLDDDKINDIKHISSKAKKYDIIIITLESKTPNDPTSYLNSFNSINVNNISKENIVTDFHKVTWELTSNIINDGCSSNSRDLEFLQLFNFKYKDTKQMYTIGGIFITNDSKIKIKELLEELTYISYDENIININCPLLTLKEKLHLDHTIQINKSVDYEKAKITGLSEAEMREYEKYYKYYPQFFESLY